MVGAGPEDLFEFGHGGGAAAGQPSGPLVEGVVHGRDTLGHLGVEALVERPLGRAPIGVDAEGREGAEPDLLFDDRADHEGADADGEFAQLDRRSGRSDGPVAGGDEPHAPAGRLSMGADQNEFGGSDHRQNDLGESRKELLALGRGRNRAEFVERGPRAERPGAGTSKDDDRSRRVASRRRHRLRQLVQDRPRKRIALRVTERNRRNPVCRLDRNPPIINRIHSPVNLSATAQPRNASHRSPRQYLRQPIQPNTLSHPHAPSAECRVPSAENRVPSTENREPAPAAAPKCWPA